jgi:YbgC/YbaW family acyl-CoA thioester hydrolase
MTNSRDDPNLRLSRLELLGRRTRPVADTTARIDYLRSWSGAGPIICGSWVRAIGFVRGTATETPGFTFVVRSMQIDFFKPAVMDDVLDIVTRPVEVKGASSTLRQQCKRGDVLLVEARVRVAFVSGGNAERIPNAFRLAMEGVA